MKNSAHVDWYNKKPDDKPMQSAASSISPRAVVLKNSGDFSYDASLRDVTSDDEMICFVIDNWSEQ